MYTTRTNTFASASQQEISILMRELIRQKEDKWVWVAQQPNPDQHRLFSLLRELDILTRAVELLTATSASE